MEQELAQLKKQVERQDKFGDDNEMEANPEDELELRQGEVAALQEDIRNLLLLVCHVSSFEFLQKLIEFLEFHCPIDRIVG
jgi:hypothetical protein